MLTAPKEVRDFGMKISTFMLCSPDEILKAIMDQETRPFWDFGVKHVSVDS